MLTHPLWSQTYLFLKEKLQENNTEMVLGEASTTISPASKCSDIEENINYIGKNINTEIEVYKQEDCCTVCQRIPNCVGWSYQPGNMSCYLKSEINNTLREESERVSGKRFCGGK